MEQLPPKPPISMSHNWPSSTSFPFQSTAAHNSWVDDFLDFSATRRNAHRRTVSDPIAFVEEDESSSSQHNNNNVRFERLDDEQLRNMFSDDVKNNPCTPSDQNNITEDIGEKKKLSPLPPNRMIMNEPLNPAAGDQVEINDTSTIFDPKRIKRILANRQSAQRSRVRKLQYISELERSVTTLQTEVSALSPRVAFLDHQRLLLNVDNSAIKQRIAALAQDKIFKDAHQEALKKEIERLRKIYHQQNMKKMANGDDHD